MGGNAWSAQEDTKLLAYVDSFTKLASAFRAFSNDSRGYIERPYRSPAAVAYHYHTVLSKRGTPKAPAEPQEHAPQNVAEYADEAVKVAANLVNMAQAAPPYHRSVDDALEYLACEFSKLQDERDTFRSMVDDNQVEIDRLQTERGRLLDKLQSYDNERQSLRLRISELEQENAAFIATFNLARRQVAGVPDKPIEYAVGEGGVIVPKASYVEPE